MNGGDVNCLIIRDEYHNCSIIVHMGADFKFKNVYLSVCTAYPKLNRSCR